MTADAILTAKLALEDEVIEPLAYAMSSYIETWSRSEGQMRLWDITGHRGMIERVLMRHYARTVSVMSGVTPTDETTIDSVALSPRHAERLRARASNQTLHIVRGMDRDLAVAMAAIPVLPVGRKNTLVTIEQKREKLTVAMAARFRETATQAWAKIKSRLKAIANIETESVAEEYQVEWVQQKHANSRIYKTWHNPMDGKERQWHHDAHLTYSEDGIPVDQPFMVGGEEMMQPGDTSRGASLANVVNCRCWSSYSIVGPDGERIQIPLQTPALPARRRWHSGDRLGMETPVRPTESITMTGRTRANVVLGDGRTFAVMHQVKPDTVVVRVDGRDVARATFSNGFVTAMTTAQDTGHLDIEGLIRRSVAETEKLRRRQ